MALWVFGYGSLLWDPGFDPAETRRAVLADYHRSFCMLSIHHRGTQTKPGLVLALDTTPGATCTGVAFRVAEPQEADVLAMLRERELVSSAYEEKTLPLMLDGGDRIAAVTYVVDRAHVQYCQFGLEEQAQRIAQATGGRGPNREYLFNTVAHLRALKIKDTDLDWLDRRVRELVD